MALPVNNPQLSVCVLASGSGGNAIHISDGKTNILLDAGLSAKETKARLAINGLAPQALSAILISHHHYDHTKGLGPMHRMYGLPVYTLHSAMRHCRNLGPVNKFCFFTKGQAFQIGGLTVHPFDTPHDAVDSVGFTITAANGHKIGIATDLGQVTNVVRQHLMGCNLLVLESNHDVEMLMNGPYPWHLKQRIKSRDGHLSNEDSANFLAEIMHDNLQHVILAHLSEKNNTPQKVVAAITKTIGSCKTKFTVAHQDYPTEIICANEKLKTENAK